MRIEIETEKAWNARRLSFVEKPSAMGDRVLVSIHEEGDDPEFGVTVMVYASDLIRAAKMLAVPYDDTGA